MPTLRIALLSCIAVASMPLVAQADAFTIDEWLLSTGVLYNSGSEGEFSNVVQNPFDHAHFASMGDSTAASQFQFAWAEDFGSFLIQTTQAAEGVPSSVLFTVSVGRIWITPTEDLSLSIDAAFSYELGADPMLASLSVSVFAMDPFTALFDVTETADSFFDPPAGTLSIEGDLILPAGRTWAMRYHMELITWGNTVGHFANGTGFADFQITPEPASLCLFALGALGLPKRNRPRSR